MPSKMAKGRILRLRGLPWSAGEKDVREFLEQHTPVDMLLLKRGEKNLGEAFVQFDSAEKAASARAERNHKSLGERYIEIFHVEADSMDTVRDEMEELHNGWVVRLRGLPFSASAEDVVTFFGDLEVSGGEQGVAFAWGRDGRPLGEAYVEFASEGLQEFAMKKDREKMGTRYIEIFKSTRADMIARTGARRNELGGHPDWGGVAGRGRRASEPGDIYSVPYLVAPPRPMTVVPSSMLRLRGLPYSATVDDIVDFFSAFHVRPEAIQLITRPGRDGRPQGTGVAFVQFTSTAEAEAARSEQHRKPMGPRYIECLPMTFPMPHPGLQQAPFPGPMGIPSGPGGGWQMPGMAAVQHPVFPGPFQMDHLGQQSLGRLGSGGLRRQQGPPLPLMHPLGMAPPQPYDPRLERPPPPPQAAFGRILQPPQGGWSGGETPPPPGGPPLPLPQQGSSHRLSPADFQQHVMMQQQQQQQFLLHQQLMQQHQAMGHLRHPSWGMPAMNPSFMGPFAHMGSPQQLQGRYPQPPRLLQPSPQPASPPQAPVPRARRLSQGRGGAGKGFGSWDHAPDAASSASVASTTDPPGTPSGRSLDDISEALPNMQSLTLEGQPPLPASEQLPTALPAASPVTFRPEG